MKFCKICKTDRPLEQFLKSYRTGKYIGNICKACYNEKSKERSKKRKNTEWYKNWILQYRAKETTKIKEREYAKKYRALYPDRYKRVNKRYRIKNKNKLKEINKIWRLENAAKVRLNNKNRSELLNKATIIKDSKIFEDMNFYYKAAKILEYHYKEKYDVDHIIPLKNKNVCGLNVPWNLTIIPKKHNNIKKNKFDGTYNNESWRQDL
jgi:hypothetical protein